MSDKASATVTAVRGATTSSPPVVDVSLLGGTAVGLRYPRWYTPAVGDVVIVDWLGSQPYIETAF